MQSNDLMISVSGVRGIVGRSLTPELLVRLGHAFGTYLRSGRVVVGRDTRVSGEMAKHAVLSGLLASGCQVLDAGVCATPSATLQIERTGADGGVMVTASHNPVEWNALKFFRADGIYLNADEGRDLLNIYYAGQFTQAQWDQLKAVQRLEQVSETHVQAVLAILDVERIRARRFRVVLDGCNGAGCIAGPLLLRELGCEVQLLHCQPDGRFAHQPEPTQKNLVELCEQTRALGADVGLALDPDADRFAAVDEQGNYIGEERGLALCTKHVLEQRGRSPGTVVINLSTSRITEEVARALGCDVLRVPAGEVHVAEKMKETRAVFGGEGNGGVIDPRVHLGRDGLVGMGLMLEALATGQTTLTQTVRMLPEYHIMKTTLECPTAQARMALRQLRHLQTGGTADLRDGLRLDWEDRWVQLRASNTEPILRIMAEARQPAQARALIDEYTQRVNEVLGTSPDAHEGSMKRSSKSVRRNSRCNENARAFSK